MNAIFEELQLTTPFQKVSFICSRQFHEQTKVQRAEDCKRIIHGINTCICHFIEKVHTLGSNDLTFFTIMKTKSNCGICQWNVPRLYHFIQNLPFYQIGQICDPKKLLSNHHVLNNNRIFTQIFQQFVLDDAIIMEIASKMTNSILFDILANKIRSTFTSLKNGYEMESDMIHSPVKLSKKMISNEGHHCDSNPASSINESCRRSIDYYFHILNICLTNDAFIQINYTQIMQLLESIFDTLITVHYESDHENVVSIVTGDYVKIAPKSLVYFILYDINKGIQLLDDHVFYCYDGTESSFEQDAYLNECLVHFAKHDYKNIEFIDFHMHSQLRFKFIEMIPIGLIMQNIANRNRGYANRKLSLFINPREILYSMANFNVMRQLADPRSYTHVVYQTSNGNYGEDAGGLTRDLYTNFPKEVVQYFGEMDEYKIPQNSIIVTPRMWRLIGIMFARSIFYENISPSISIHPIVVYMMLYGYQSIILDHFFETLAPFNIEYIQNLKKIQTMTIHEYFTFLSLQGEETYISKKEYIQTQILDRYIQTPIQKFILGYRTIIQSNRRSWGSNVSILNHVSFVDFWKYIRGIESYRINTTDHGSLSQNLKVEPDDNAVQRIWIWEEDGDRLKESFIRVLDELNRTNISALKAFLQFWFGTDSIADFSNKKPVITILANDSYPGCFGARTCFDELLVHKSILKLVDGALDAKVGEYIESSLRNQTLTQSIGLNMQMM